MADDQQEVELAGGGVNRVFRAGATVRRPSGPWTATVHALLDQVHRRGFDGAPRAHGLDSQGREVLDFIPGDVGHRPLTDDALAAVGALLREFHDATADFTPPADATWFLPAREPAEVVCHGDIAPYNCVFRDGRPVAFIDFDTAHPGPRVWDFAYAAYRFAPLTDPGNDDFHLPLEDQARRLRVLADAYRLSPEDREAVADTARDRLDHLVRLMHDQAAAGNTAFAGHITAGHDRLYRRDATHIARHAAHLTAALRP